MAKRLNNEAPPGKVEGRVNALDLALLDVLAQAEAMMRRGREIQRKIVTLRGGDGPLTPEKRSAAVTKIRSAAAEMKAECHETAPLVDEVVQAAIELQ
jgi:hypothetical protein